MPKFSFHPFFLILVVLAGIILPAAERSVHIIHTSDLHAHIEKDEHGNGLLCISSAINAIRKEAGAENTLYIDTGDTVQGTMAGSLTKGILPLQVLLAMGCDVWVPGNHEFDFGMAQFGEYAKLMDPVMLCGNLHALHPNSSLLHPHVSWRLFHRNGLNIAVIGMNSSYLAHWFRSEFEENYRVEPAMDVLKSIMPSVIAAQPDAIILAIHQGWCTPQQDPRGVNEVAAIAEAYPEIDLILGGHTHRPFPGNPIGKGCWYMQPGADARYFGHAIITCDSKKHRVTCITSVLVSSATSSTDKTLSASMSKALADFKDIADQVIVPSMPFTITADGLPGRDNAMSLAFCKALCNAAHTTLALHGTLSQTPLHEGKPVTERDLFSIVPYENNIVIGHFTREEIEEILTEQWSFRKHYSYCGFYGAQVEFDKEGKAHVSDLGEGRHAVAMNSFTAAGGGRYNRLAELLEQPETKTINTGISTRDAMREYLRTLVK